MPFSKVTAPNAPYCPFITGLSIEEEEEEEEETAGGATKQRSNKLMEEESPSTTVDDEEEEEKALSTRTPLLLRANYLPATYGKYGSPITTFDDDEYDDKVFIGIICAVWNTT